MENFAYARPTALDAAVAAGADAYLAGGTELLNWMRLGVAAPKRVLDITRIEALRGITADAVGLRLGALATLNEVGRHPDVVRDFPVLAQACLAAASGQIRNRATIAGNLLQKTRCPYFRSEGALPWPCNRRAPGSGCSALDGENRNHAIFGWTEDCVATHPADPPVAFTALDAVIETAQGRTIPVAELHRLGAGPDTVLEPGELITAIRVPANPTARRSHYLKVRERSSYEYATVAVAAAVALDGGRIADARIALGSVALKPWRLPTAEAALRGQSLDVAAIEAAIAPAFAEARPLSHNAYKIDLAQRAVVRALLAAGDAP